MHIIKNDSHIVSMRQVEENVAAKIAPKFSFESHQKAYAWINEILDRFGYHKRGKNRRSKKEKVSVRKYIQMYTAYSRSQLTRLIKEKKKFGTLTYGKGKKRNTFKKIYTEEDAQLLALANHLGAAKSMLVRTSLGRLTESGLMLNERRAMETISDAVKKFKGQMNNAESALKFVSAPGKPLTNQAKIFLAELRRQIEEAEQEWSQLGFITTEAPADQTKTASNSTAARESENDNE